MGRVELTLEEYAALLGSSGRKPRRKSASPKKSRKSAGSSAYGRRYGAAFKRIAPKNKKKSGGWKQGGFARTQKAAHKAAKR